MKYRIDVTETSYGFVEIEADSEAEALAKVDEEYHSGNIVWSSSEITKQEVIE